MEKIDPCATSPLGRPASMALAAFTIPLAETTGWASAAAAAHRSTAHAFANILTEILLGGESNLMVAQSAFEQSFFRLPPTPQWCAALSGSRPARFGRRIT